MSITHTTGRYDVSLSVGSKLAAEWASKHNAEIVDRRAIEISADDVYMATVQDQPEFDDYLDYIDEKDRRFKKAAVVQYFSVEHDALDTDADVRKEAQWISNYESFAAAGSQRWHSTRQRLLDAGYSVAALDEYPLTDGNNYRQRMDEWMESVKKIWPDAE